MSLNANETIEDLIKLYESDIEFKKYCDNRAFDIYNKGEISAHPFLYKNEIIGLIFVNYFKQSNYPVEFVKYSKLHSYFLEFNIKKEKILEDLKLREKIDKQNMIEFNKQQARLI